MLDGAGPGNRDDRPARLEFTGEPECAVPPPTGHGAGRRSATAARVDGLARDALEGRSRSGRTHACEEEAREEGEEEGAGPDGRAEGVPRSDAVGERGR